MDQMQQRTDAMKREAITGKLTPPTLLTLSAYRTTQGRSREIALAIFRDRLKLEAPRLGEDFGELCRLFGVS